MKALLRTAPGEVAVVERPTPEPGPGEVLVRVLACGICGSDLARYRDPDEKWDHVILGHECAGVVEALGPGTAGLSPGQRVALLPLRPDFTCPHCAAGRFSLCDGYSFYGSRKDGGFAEYLVAPVENLLPLPDEVGDEAGAMLEPLSVATQACLLAGMTPRSPLSREGEGPGVRPPFPPGAGRSVLVMGAGAIGLLAVEVALALGAGPVLACDVIAEKLRVAAALGAEALLSGPSLPEEIRALTDGRGVDVALECSGHPAACGPALDALGKGGTLVLVGTGPGEVTLSAEQREQMCRRMVTVRGQWMSYGPPWPGAPWTLPLELLRAGRLDPARLITARGTLEQAPELIRGMLRPGAEFLKVMLTPGA